MPRLARCIVGLCTVVVVFTTLEAAAAEKISAEHGVAAGRDIRDSTITIGFTFEQVQKFIQSSTQELKTTYQAQVDELSQRLEVRQDAVIGFFAILKRERVSPEKLAETLSAIAQRHREMLERLASLDPEDPTIKALIDKAQAAIKEGDYARADLLLTQAEAADLAAAHEAQALAQQAQAAAERRLLNAAATRAERGEIRLTQLKYQEAADHFKAASQIVPKSHPTVRGEYLRRYADALATYGDQKGVNDALRQAIHAYNEVLDALTRERAPLQWAMTQNNLGFALQRLGERESGTERLEQAMVAYSEALKEYTRERVPLQWATAQNNLGNALRILGERESGTERLEQAMVAYSEALKERTRERVPLDWAMTQNNLGFALQRLGEWESGTERLEQAVVAYSEALKERTRERVPLDWAMTQTNLGNALLRLGERENNIEHLRKAEAVIQSAYAVVKEAGYDQYDAYFEERLRSLRELIGKQ
jgi:tetratricopeptide (TPR) repeat protein